MAETTIEAVALTKMYGRFVAIADVGFTVRRGEFMGLLGPNGAGKSTTLKIVTGLIRPTSGTVTVGGVDIRDHRHAMEHVGCVIETPEPYPDFSPREILAYVGRLYGLDRRETEIRTRDVLEILRMWEWRDSNVGSFSKGMRQRVVLAQALLPNPEIIVLDEPTSGLDPRGMIEIRQALSDLRSKERSLLISTHILSEVSELCGSVTMIRKGRVIASGETSELVRGLASERAVSLEIRTLRPITPEVVTDLEGCQGVSGSSIMGDHTLRLEFSGSLEDQAHVTDVAVGSGLGILEMNERGSNLESLYMELTSGEEIQ